MSAAVAIQRCTAAVVAAAAAAAVVVVVVAVAVAVARIDRQEVLAAVEEARFHGFEDKDLDISRRRNVAGILVWLSGSE